MAKGAVYGCGPVVSKYLLIILNVIFFILGLALIVVGTIVLSNTQDFLAILGSTANLIGGSIIGFGAFVFLTAFSGCCGALRESIFLLKTYFFIVLLVIVGEATLAIIMSASNIFNNFVDTTGLEGFQDLQATNPELLTETEAKIGCCGWDALNDTYPDIARAPEFCTLNGTILLPPCHEKIDDFFTGHVNIVIGVAAAVFTIQFMGEVMTICMWRNIRQEYMYV